MNKKESIHRGAAGTSLTVFSVSQRHRHRELGSDLIEGECGYSEELASVYSTAR